VGTALFLLLFFGLLAAGMPVFLVLGLCAAVLFMISNEPLIGLTQVMINELNSPTLMALPLFVMAAAFMRRGGVARALVELATALFGSIQGSLGLVTVVACALFASICGSSVATALAMGTILIPAMLERGYPRPFVMGVTGASGTIGIVIPPSLALVLYGIITEQSVPRLFLAVILPGILQAVAFAVWVIYYARKKGFPREPSVPFRQTLCSMARAAPAMGVPLIVVGGIYGGLVTVTEAATLAALAALFVSLFVYRGFHWTKTRDVIADAIRNAAIIMMIVATALAFGHWMTASGAPAALVQFTLDHQMKTWMFLLSVNILLLILGCFLEAASTLLVVMPILAPALRPLGVDAVHFAIIFTHKMEIALVHPPVGLNLYVLSTICDAPGLGVIKGILPFLILLLTVLAIITYVPILTTWLPDRIYGVSG
jgi:C4-dicarboxylate transporter DctM subunit